MRCHYTTVVGGLALLIPALSGASLLEKSDVRQLTQQSSAIRTGLVTSQWSSWDPQTRMIYTYIKLKVDKTIKGIPAQEVLLRQPGGESQGVRMVVHGAATFVKGERSLVFTQLDRDGAPTLVGLAQGKYRIHRDHKTGEEMATMQIPANAELVEPTVNGRIRHLSHRSMAHEISLSALVQQIQAIVETKQSVRGN